MEYQQSDAKFSFDTDAFDYTNEEQGERLVFADIGNNVDSLQVHEDENAYKIQENDKTPNQLEFQQNDLDFLKDKSCESEGQHISPRKIFTEHKEDNQFETKNSKNPEQESIPLPGEYATSVYTQESLTTPSEHVGEGLSQEASFPEGSKTMETTEESESIKSGETQNPNGPKSERELLAQKAQDIINDLNSKRKKDTKLLEDFRAAVLQNDQESCSLVENFMVESYEDGSATIQDKLNELFAILDRVALLEEELGQFKHALGVFYQDTVQGKQ